MKFDGLSMLDTALLTMGLSRTAKTVGVGSFFLGIGVGLVAGGAAALLLTPYNGTQAREKLAKAGEDLGNTVTSKVNQLKSRTGQNGHSLQGSSMPASSYDIGQGTRVSSL